MRNSFLRNNKKKLIVVAVGGVLAVVAIVISVVLFFAPNDGLPSYSEEEKVEALLQDEEATSNTTIAKWYNIGIWILKGSAQMKK